ncbi:MAG: ABA4-like family protein, partial [Pirellulales bacterium]|nr:ABA4-like family protein [Pirellulales bacterium]
PAQTLPEVTMAEQLFQITNTVALLAWLPLLVLPGNRFVTGTLCRRLVPAGLAVCYVAVIGWKLAAGGPPPGDVMTIAGLRQAFADDFVFAAAWTHYLVFDMVVGTVSPAKRSRPVFPGR